MEPSLPPTPHNSLSPVFLLQSLWRWQKNLVGVLEVVWGLEGLGRGLGEFEGGATLPCTPLDTDLRRIKTRY